MILKIDNKPNLVKDEFSKAITNVDRSKFINAKIAKHARQQKIDRINKLESEVLQLKRMLSKILEKQEDNINDNSSIK